MSPERLIVRKAASRGKIVFNRHGNFTTLLGDVNGRFASSQNKIELSRYSLLNSLRASLLE